MQNNEPKPYNYKLLYRCGDKEFDETFILDDNEKTGMQRIIERYRSHDPLDHWDYMAYERLNGFDPTSK